MATKTVNLDEAAYAILKRLKRDDDDSFSRVVKRNLGGRAAVEKLFGILKGRKGDRLASTVRKARVRDRRRERRRMKRTSEALR